MLPRHIVYWVLSIASLLLLTLEAPTGALLATAPDRGRVEKGPQAVRGRPIFIWTGGGYQGGK